MLTDQRFIIGVVAGVALCYAFHHWMPGRAAAAHGMRASG